MHGYEMITELDTRTGGVWRPSPGSVYPTLQLLEDEGLIVSEAAGGRKRFTPDRGRPHRGARPARPGALGADRRRGRRELAATCVTPASAR